MINELYVHEPILQRFFEVSIALYNNITQLSSCKNMIISPCYKLVVSIQN